MKRFFIYTALQTKKVMKTFPAMLLMTGLLGLVLSAMLYLQTSRASSAMSGDEDSMVSIGIIGADSSPYLKLGLSMLENMDPSKVAVRFENLDRQQAVKKLRSGSLTAAIEIPEGMTDRLLSGRLDTKMTLILPGTQTGAAPLLVKELSRVISSMIMQMEAASFSLEDFYRESGVTSDQDISDAKTDLLYTSLKKILKRNHLFTLRRIKTESTLTIESYYLCAMFLLLVLMVGVMCAGSYIRGSLSLEMLLRIRGFSSEKQIAAEYLSLLVFMLALGAVFIPGAGLILSKMPVAFSELSSWSPEFFRNFTFFALKAIPAVLMAAAMDIFLYETADSLISGVLLQFLVMIVLAYLSGVFFPDSSLPAGMQKILPFLPTGQAMLYLRKLLTASELPRGHLAAVISFGAFFLLLACAVRRYKLSKAGHS